MKKEEKMKFNNEFLKELKEREERKKREKENEMNINKYMEEANSKILEENYNKNKEYYDKIKQRYLRNEETLH